MDELSKPAPRCTRCGAALRNSSGGLCPACLLQGALTTWTEEDAAAEGAASLIRRRRLGGYELISEVAHGAMGVVFRARQKNPSRVVALKVISSGELATPRMVERFNNEALAAARLNHPNIVPIYEVGEDRGWHFFSMEFVEGRTLADLIREQRPEPAVAVGLMIKIARAVEHAHQRGILHRDLKPANILLDASNEPRLTDFGLAKITAHDTDITRTHAVLGSPAYMSPEQARGNSRDITTATDVHGLGAIFYELLSGNPPFQAENTPALLRKIAEEEAAPFRNQRTATGSGSRTDTGPDTDSAVRWLKTPRRVPRDLEVICLKCLEKSPAKRYATAGELADELERWRRNEPIHARTATGWERTLKWVQRHKGFASVLGTILLAGFALTLISLLFNIGLNKARQAALASAARSREQLLRDHLSQASGFTERDDAFVSALWAAGALQASTPLEAANQRARDRLQLIFQFSPRLLRVRALPEEFTRLEFTENGRFLTLENSMGSNLRWNLADDTAHDRAVASASPTTRNGSPGVPAREESLTSPDGAIIATAGLDYSVQLRRATDGRVLGSLLRHGARVSAWAFSPDARYFATVSADLLARVWDLGSSAVTLFPFTLPVHRPVFSPDGHRFVAVSGATEFRVCDAATGKSVSGALDGGGKLTSVAFAKSGRHFATATDHGLIRVWESNPATQVAELQADGTYLSLEFNPQGNVLGAANPGKAWLWHWSDSSKPAREFTPDSVARRIEWSPDGKLFLIAGHRGVRLWSAATVEPVGEPILPAMYGFTARFNPAGTLLVASFQQKDAQPSFAQVYSVPKLETVGLPIKHGDGVRDVRFTIDGRQVVTSGADAAIRVRNPETGQPTLPVMHHTGPVSNTGFSPDQRWLVSCGSGDVRVWEMASGQLLAPTLHFPVEIYEATFCLSNRSLLLRGERDFSWFIPLNLARFSDEELAGLAILTSGHSRDAVGGLNAVPARELEERYRDLRKRVPNYFAWPEDSSVWHEQEAAFSRFRKDWRGAVFHLEWLARMRPGDSATVRELDEARANLRQ